MNISDKNIEGSGSLMKVTFEQICEEIKREGIENVRFIVPMARKVKLGPFNVYSDKKDPVSCVILQPDIENVLYNELYNFFERYKIHIQSEDPNYGTLSYYVDDFISLINEGKIEWVRSNH